MELTDAQRDLVETHLWLVACIAKTLHRTLPPCVERDDIEQAGRMGLIDAAMRFDASKGSTFATFARWRINGAIRDYLRSLDAVSKDLRAQISAGEASEYVEMPIDELHREPRATQESPEELSMAAQISAQISTLMEGLSGRQRTVLRRYYYHDQTMARIGSDLGVKEPRISQIRKQAIETLREQPGFLAHKVAFRFAMNSGLLSRLGGVALGVVAFVLAASSLGAQTTADVWPRGCPGSTVQITVSVPLTSGAITVPVPVCVELGTGLRLDTSVSPPRLDATAATAAIPRAVVQKFAVPSTLPAATTSLSFDLTYTPTPSAGILVAFRSRFIGGDSVDFVMPAGGAAPKTLRVSVPNGAVPGFRPVTAEDQVTVMYWTTDAP